MLRIFALVLTLASSACHTMTFEVTKDARQGEVRDRKAFFLWGLVPTMEVDVSAKCPQGVASIREETTFTDGFFGFITLGIYSPRTSYYFCLPPAASRSPS